MATRGVLTTGSWAPASKVRAAHRASAWGWLRRAFQVNTSRHTLAEMDDRMLADIGISRAQAATEANRAPWDIEPARFRR